MQATRLPLSTGRSPMAPSLPQDALEVGRGPSTVAAVPPVHEGYGRNVITLGQAFKASQETD